MFWLIEDINQLKGFDLKGYKEAFVEVIPYSNWVHPVLNQVSLVYIKPLNGDKGYIVASNHSEAFHMEKDLIQETLEKIDKIYVRDKKQFLHYFHHKACYSCHPSSPTYIPEPTQAHTFYYNKYHKRKDTNRLIPIVKHYEFLEEIYKNQTFPDTPNLFYDNKTSIVFNMIERSGIKIDNNIYEQYFDYPNSDYAYTQYNLNTTTTRPSNSFGGINFAALNKENGERNSFIPRNDVFLDLDISAYHPTLLAKLLDYKFDNEDIHKAFAEMYKVDYKKAKELTFKQLYGGVFKQYEHLEFFSRVKKYTKELWEKFNEEGYIECPISKYRFEKDKLENMNPQKLLNYLLQNLETSNNIVILYKILKLLQGKNTKLVLYVYDSFLLDVDKSEKDVLKKIKDIFDKHKLKIKSKTGKTYNF